MIIYSFLNCHLLVHYSQSISNSYFNDGLLVFSIISLVLIVVSVVVVVVVVVEGKVNWKLVQLNENYSNQTNYWQIIAIIRINN